MTVPRQASSPGQAEWLVPSAEVLTQEMDRNVFLSHRQKLDSDRNLLFTHLHEILRFSVNNLQQNGLVTLAVLSAGVS